MSNEQDDMFTDTGYGGVRLTSEVEPPRELPRPREDEADQERTDEARTDAGQDYTTPRSRPVSKPSQVERLLAHLREYGHITKDEGRDALGIMNVGGRILDLRLQGHDIVTEMIPVKNRLGEETEVAKYKLLAEVIP